MLEWYENVLLSNASQITAVESSLRSITYFLPGRFPDSELAGEAIYSALNLLGLYHDSILVRLLSPAQLPRTIGSSEPLTKRGKKDASRIMSRSAPPSLTTQGAPAPPATYSKLQHTPSEHARYTHHFSDSSSAYSTAARLLVIIGYTELLAEMVARRRLGDKRAWNVVVGIESVKTVLRLALVRLTDTRPTIQPPIPEREVDPAMLEEDRRAALERLTSTSVDTLSFDESVAGPSNALRSEVWRGSRTGLTRPTLHSIHQRAHPEASADPAPGTKSAPRSRHPLSDSRSRGMRSPSVNNSGSGSESDSDDTLVDSWTEKDVNEFLLSRTLTPNDVKRSEDLVRQLRNGMGYAAEFIWIVRPLLYVLALRRWGRKHKTPFFLSFGLEYLAGLMRVRALTPPGSATNGSSPLSNPLLMAMMGGDSVILNTLARLTGSGPKEARPTSEVERQEWERRKRAFWWYLLRGPAWHSFTRPKLESLARATENRPLLSIIGGIVRDYLPLVDDYYYYSST